MHCRTAEEGTMEVTSLFAPYVADRMLFKIPPALIKGFLRGLPTHASLNACKAVDRFLTFYKERIEMLDRGVSRARRAQHCLLPQGSQNHPDGAVRTVKGGDLGM